MRLNQTKRLLAGGRPAIGTFCASASALIVEALGHSGYDYVMVDLQHGENNLGNLQSMLQALSSTPATPLVRVPANMPVYIQRALDLGAYGVIVPLVNTREDAAAVMQSVRYAPAGGRSWGPVRGLVYGGPDYFDKANEELLTIVMIETVEGLKNAREIMSVPGVDGCLIGPKDLTLSLGFSPDPSELPPPVEEAIGAILEEAQAAGKAGGIVVFSTQAAQARIKQGFSFICFQTDLRMLRTTAIETLQAIKR